MPCNAPNDSAPCPARAAANDFSHRRRTIHDEFGINCRHDTTNGRENTLAWTVGRDHVRQPPVPVAGELTIAHRDGDERLLPEYYGDLWDVKR